MKTGLSTIPIVSIISGANIIEIHYGVGSFGAKAPTAKKTSEFLFAVKGSAGTFTNIGAVEVDVHSQASGRGSASIAATNATAGHPDGSIVITYDPIGQIANGRIKLTVPDELTGGADAAGVTAAHISVSTGSAKYGGSVDHDLEANDDVTKDDVLVSGVNLSASGTFTFTYEGMMPEAAGDLGFTVAVDGGEGPGEVAEGMPTPMALIDGSGALSVTVGDAAAGSGTVMVTKIRVQLSLVRPVTPSQSPTRRSARSAKVRQSQLPFPPVGQHRSMRQQPTRSWEPSPLRTTQAELMTMLMVWLIWRCCSPSVR